MLREQYYIDFLVSIISTHYNIVNLPPSQVKILEDLLPKDELEMWVEYQNIMRKEKSDKEREKADMQGSSSSESSDEDINA